MNFSNFGNESSTVSKNSRFNNFSVIIKFMNTQDKADDYNERAKKQIRTKAYQKGQEETEAEYKDQIKQLKKEKKELQKLLDEKLAEIDAKDKEIAKLKKKLKL